MPRVPIYDVPQVEQRALPGARQSSIVSPEMLAAPAVAQGRMAQAVMGAGAGVANIAGMMQERENADMLFRAETTLKDDYLQFEQSLRERKGQQAWGATRDTEQWFADQAKKQSETLQNDAQRRLFGQSLTKMRQQALGSVSTYEAGERRRSLEESANASIVGSINMAAANAGDWYGRAPAPAAAPPTEGQPPGDGATVPPSTQPRDPITGIKSDILKRVQVLTDINGWSPERKAAEEEKVLTNLHQQVIQSLAVKTPGRAREYYEANKEEIAGTARAGVEKALLEGETRETAQAFADEIQTRGVDLTAALAEARQKFSGETEVAVTQEIKTRFAEAAAAMQRGQAQAADSAWKVVTAGGGRAQIPLPTWNGMAGEEQRQILDYLRVRAERAQNADGRDDLVNLDIVERLIEQGDITDKAGLAKYQPYFKPATLRTLSNKIDKRAMVPPADIRRVFEERKGERVNPAKMGDSDRAEWMAFQDFILTNVREARRPEDIDVWADRWFMRGYGKDDSVLRNDPNTFGEARTAGRKDFVISTPEAERDSVDTALALLERNGVQMPKDRGLARDELYTSAALEARRWAGARSMQATPELTAAYALLKRNNKPVTPANIEYVIRQFK